MTLSRLLTFVGVGALVTYCDATVQIVAELVRTTGPQPVVADVEAEVPEHEQWHPQATHKSPGRRDLHHPLVRGTCSERSPRKSMGTHEKVETAT